MNTKSLAQKVFILTFVFISFFSCTKESIIDENEETIDLNLVQENNWNMSNSVLELINIYRENINKTPLKKDMNYATAYAVKHSKYMIENNTVSHDFFFNRSNGLKDRGATYVRENVAYGYTSAQSVFNAWLKSESHRVTIEGDYSYIGFGIVKSAKNKFYYTLLFYK